MYKIILHYFFSIISLVLVGLFYNQEVILVLVLILLSIFLLLLEKSKKELLLFILSSIAGTIAESIAIYFGAWSYTKTIFFIIPFWLPFLWGIAALFIKRLYEQIELISLKIKK